MNKNSFLPPLRHISNVPTVIKTYFKVVIYGWIWSWNRTKIRKKVEPEQETKLNNFGSATLVLVVGCVKQLAMRSGLPDKCGGFVSFWYGSGSRIRKNSLRIRRELWYGSGFRQKRHGSGSRKKGFRTRKSLKCDKKNAQIPCFVCVYYLTISFS